MSSLSFRPRDALVVRKSPFNCAKKIVGRYRLGQEVIRTRLDGPHRGREYRDAQ